MRKKEISTNTKKPVPSVISNSGSEITDFGGWESEESKLRRNLMWTPEQILTWLEEINKFNKENCKIPVDPMGLANADIRSDWIKNKNMKALNFYCRLEEIYLIIDSPVKYSNAKKILFAVKGINYPIVSKDDLIKMKQKTDRPLVTRNRKMKYVRD